MADRQTALAVFDFLDSLRAGQYRIGADAEKDHATAGLLASLSGDTGLRDAVCAKLISPGLERARFLMVAEHDPRALPLFASGQVKTVVPGRLQRARDSQQRVPPGHTRTAVAAVQQHPGFRAKGGHA